MSAIKKMTVNNISQKISLSNIGELKILKSLKCPVSHNASLTESTLNSGRVHLVGTTRILNGEVKQLVSVLGGENLKEINKDGHFHAIERSPRVIIEGENVKLFVNEMNEARIKAEELVMDKCTIIELKKEIREYNESINALQEVRDDAISELKALINCKEL